MVVGIDIGSTTTLCQGFSREGIGFGKIFKFSINWEDYVNPKGWMQHISIKINKSGTIIGIELKPEQEWPEGIESNVIVSKILGLSQRQGSLPISGIWGVSNHRNRSRNWQDFSSGRRT